MQAELQDRLALRIDVDFPTGLRRAVPSMLEALKRAGMQATFFVVAGANRTPLSRLLRPGYLRRLARLGPGRVLGAVGPSVLFGGGAFLGSDRARAVLRRIRDEGHEVAVHGFDHAWWAESVWSADSTRLSAEIDRAFDAMGQAEEKQGQAWGSPNWRTTPFVLGELGRRGVPYLSECWGSAPFRSCGDDGAAIPLAHLPVTLPSLETLVLEDRLPPAQAVQRALDAHTAGQYGLACLHDYFEGLMRPELFAEFLDACARRGLRTVTLRETATPLDPGRLPVHDLARGPLRGFAGDVSLQGEARPEA